MSAELKAPARQAWPLAALTLWWQHWFALLAINTVSLLLCLSMVLLPAGLLLPFTAARRIVWGERLEFRPLFRELLPGLVPALLLTLMNAGAVLLFRLAVRSYAEAGFVWLVPLLYALAFVWVCLQLKLLATLAQSPAAGLSVTARTALRFLFASPAGSLLSCGAAMVLAVAALRLPVLLLGGIMQLVPLATLLRLKEHSLADAGTGQ